MKHNFKYINRYSEYYSDQNKKFALIDGKLFSIYNHMIIPIGPIVQNFDVSFENALDLLKKLKGVMVRYTLGFQLSNEFSDWYAIICDNFIPIEKIKSKQRYQINRGMNNCSVERIDASFLAKNGYEIYYEALIGYGKKASNIMDRNLFYHNVMNNASYDDIIHYWGVFYREKLIAFATVHIYDKVEANYSSVKFHPDYLSYYPSYALFYTLNEFYLFTQKYTYVNDGFKSILHTTNIQNFLIQKFNFRKQAIPLNMIYRTSYSFFMKLSYPLRKPISLIDDRLNSLFELERIRRQL